MANNFFQAKNGILTPIITLRVAQGTAPIEVTSTTPVDHLCINGNAATSTYLKGGNSTTLMGSIPYQSDTNITSFLTPNTSTKKFLRQTGVNNNGAAPAWDTIEATDIANSIVIEKVLTAYTKRSSLAALAASDTILQAIQKLDGNDDANLISAKSYADGLIVGLWDDRGAFNASVNTFPTTGGSGTNNAILKGDIWTISVIAVSGPLLGYPIGTNVRAIIDTPGQTVGNWAVVQSGIGYVPANVATDLSQFASTTSAQLAGVISNETGYSTGAALVFSISPNLVTPVLGTPTSGNFSTGTFTWPTFNQSTTGTAAKASNLVGGLGGSLPYQSAVDTTLFLANGNAGQILRSAGTTAAPIWSTPTYPNTATNGCLLIGNGTNIVLSTPTYPNVGTANKILIGNGTDIVLSTPKYPNASATALKYIRSDGTDWITSSATISDSPGIAGKILISDGSNWITSTPTYPNAATPTSRKIIVSDGTNWVASTETHAVPGSTGNILTSDGTNWIAAAPGSAIPGTVGTWTFSNAVLFPLGTALLPAITTPTDLNTGIWFTGADVLAISTAGVERLRIDASGNVGIGTIPSGGNKLEVNGAFAATTKSFIIDHPSKPNRKLQYGSLESPYYGVRLTGQDIVAKGSCIVELPDYMSSLVNSADINIQLTNIKHNKTLYIDSVDLNKNQFTVKSNSLFNFSNYQFYWTFTATRKDVKDLIVEF